MDTPDWWRSAVVYQVYPRSFADSNGDGTGDVGGLIEKLPYLKDLGVDAVWVNPWYPSPLADGGYDVSDYRDIHPDFGTLAQGDEFIAKAHELGLKVLIDLVPNHCSDQHAWFQAALRAGPHSKEREPFIFRDGLGDSGDEPPSNWTALFGGSMWQRVYHQDGTAEQWFLHMFAPEQPDWNWAHQGVHEEFESILRFWFDRDVDGFRIDVADSMEKDMTLKDMPIDPRLGVATLEKYVGSPVFDQPGVHDIHREWRKVADSYADSELGQRIFVSEAWLTPAERLAKYVREDELHCTFNFDALSCAWHAGSQRNVINTTVTAMSDVGAPCTWVLANHDTIRPVTRYGKPQTGALHTPDGRVDSTVLLPSEYEAMPTDVALGRRRARAAALLELALPGGAYIYQGDELGLEEVEDLPEDVLQDPTWLRSGGTLRGRDGCRVPLPWRGSESPFGFGRAGKPWLPQPSRWVSLTAEAQAADPDSTLSLYKAALSIRKSNPALGDGEFSWNESASDAVLDFTREPGFRCLVNISDAPLDLPQGARVLVASGDVSDGSLAVDDAVWLQV